MESSTLQLGTRSLTWTSHDKPRPLIQVCARLVLNSLLIFLAKRCSSLPGTCSFVVSVPTIGCIQGSRATSRDDAHVVTWKCQQNSG